jgi:hypothetical protein
MIELLQKYNLYPTTCTWVTSRTRILEYKNGYVKVIVERERPNKLINKMLYKNLKPKL